MDQDVDTIDLPGIIPYMKLAADSTASWSFVAQTLQHADITKVKDTKEDIDTLLVFAGLFSAVMTAFIIESYKKLLPDQGASTVDVLQTIATRMTSFIVNDQFVNSTTLATTNEDSNPPITYIRINALWFASLICSLVSASLGMLVKQWLREYLAVDYLSPQARVRIRQFRWEGLRRWKVFEIAAILPLLLQTALGLFFLGICFFTLSINTTVGWTSTPLVLAWVTFFAFTVLAPAISAHCPFKTTFLKFALKSIRRVLRHHVSPLSEKPSGSRGSPSTPGRTSTSSLTLADEKSSQDKEPKEEEDAVMNHTQDLGILLAFDAINSDDELLGTVVRTILTPTRRNGAQVLTFVQTIIAHRLQRDVSALRPLQYSPYLAPRARLALVDILSDALCYEVHERLFSTAPYPTSRDAEGNVLSGWMHTALEMIVGLAGDTMQRSEAAAMAYCLMFDPVTFKEVMGKSRLTTNDLLTLLGVAQDRLRNSPGSAIMDFLRNTSQWYTERSGQPPAGSTLADDTTLSTVLRTSERKMPEECLSGVLGLLADTLRAQLERRQDWMGWMTEALDCLMDSTDPTEGYYCVSALDKISDLVVILFTENPYDASKVLESMTRIPPFDGHSRYWMIGLIVGRKLSKVPGGIPAMLRNLEDVLTVYATMLRPVRVCTVLCNMASYFFAPEDIHTHRSQWRALFSALSRMITPTVDLTLSDRLAIAHCLERIDVFDNVEATAPGVPKDGAKVEPIVPDNLIEVLSGIAEDAARRVENLDRVSKLREQRQRERAAYGYIVSRSETRSVTEEQFEDAQDIPAADFSLLSPVVGSPDLRYQGGYQPASSRNGYPKPTYLPSPTIASYRPGALDFATSYDPSIMYPSMEEWLLSQDNDPLRSRQHQLKYTPFAQQLGENGIYDLGDLLRLRMTESVEAVRKLQDLGGMVYGIASRLMEFAQVDGSRLAREHQRQLDSVTADQRTAVETAS